MTSLLAEPTIPHVSDSADTKPSANAPTKRRHDLDALRAIAMLLGIVLHAAISFAPIPWAVSDSQQSESYGVLFACIHGFRMPLFFLLSGFFTAMLWRRRGLGGLIRQRLKRIALPLFIGLFTIIPAMWVVTIYVSRTGASVGDDVSDAVIAGDIDRLRAALEKPQVDVNRLHSGSGASPLSTAVFLDKPRNGGDVDRSRRGCEPTQPRRRDTVARRGIYGTRHGRRNADRGGGGHEGDRRDGANATRSASNRLWNHEFYRRPIWDAAR